MSDPAAGAALSDSPEAPPCWQAARLAATLFAIGRLGHDLRGAFSPALLASERLLGHEDPAVRRAADIVLRAIDRATDALGETLRQVRGGEAGRALEPVRLREACGGRAGAPAARAIPEDATVLADPAALALALDALLAHVGAPPPAFEAQCRDFAWTITLRGAAQGVGVSEPDFSAARDWLRSCGGDLLRTDADLAMVLRAA